MTTTRAQTAGLSRLARRVLQTNSCFSAIIGIALIVASRPIASLLGPDIPLVLLIVGIAVLLFAPYLFWAASRPAARQQLVVLIGISDALWVAFSVVLLLLPGIPFTGAGRWTIALLALAVADFACMEFYSLWRAR